MSGGVGDHVGDDTGTGAGTGRGGAATGPGGAGTGPGGAGTGPGGAGPAPLRTRRLSVPLPHGTGLDPQALHAALRRVHGDAAFLLESGQGPSTDARTTTVGVAGALELAVRRGAVTLVGDAALVAVARRGLLDGPLTEAVHDGTAGRAGRAAPGLRLRTDDNLWRLPEALLELLHGPAVDARPGAADEGAVPTELLTVWGYDAVRYAERLPGPANGADGDAPPDAWFAGVRVAVVVDLLDPTVLRVVAHEGGAWTAADTDRVVSLVTAVAAAGTGADPGELPPVPPPTSVVDEMTPEAFRERAERCAEHVRAGDVYQVQLGHAVRVRSAATPAAVYARLARRNPSPYMALFTVEDRTVVAASPELFVRSDGRRAVMRPIAGTAAGGSASPAPPVASVGPRPGPASGGDEPLRSVPKERAEHVMLVDLCRNDLGRVARAGTVEVTDLLAVERYSHLHHLVSTVEAELLPGTGVGDLVRACFPAGTMTGAPKVEAMAVVDRLEVSPRGLYAGAFGLVGRGGVAVLGLAIRTAVHRGDEWTLRASAGIVVGSRPESEWAETRLKLAAPCWAVTGEELA